MARLRPSRVRVLAAAASVCLGAFALASASALGASGPTRKAPAGHRHPGARTRRGRHARRGRHTRRAQHRRHHKGAVRTRPCPGSGLQPTAANLALVRAATLCLINREREVHGERRLRANARMQRAAQGHSRSMAFGDYFEHDGASGPGGGTPLARLRAVGYISSSGAGYEVGENIAWGTLAKATPRAIVAAWMRSPGHRANILDPRYRETGIGVSPHAPASLAEGQPGAIYTQDFGVITRG
ncbi:MAG TPA: CAP domain-containing protein [Solirubrobacteraceae bacterium]|nr:CAP domain-containing protein [Solirubrobacteraceae bacterium]